MSTSLTLSADQQMDIFLIIKRGFNTDYMVQIFQKNHRITASVGSRISQTRAPIYRLAMKSFPKNCMKMKQIGPSKIFFLLTHSV